MRKLYNLIAVLVLVGASYGQIFGNAFPAAGGLANLEIGKQAGRKVDIRFVGENSAQLASVLLYMKTGVGYSLGTGGTVKVCLQADDGTANHFPAGVDLVCSSAAPGNPASPTFRTFTFTGAPILSVGLFYHLVMTNSDADPINNYVSLDDLGNSSGTAAPYYSGSPISLNCATSACFTNFAIVWQNTAPPWVVNQTHIPIVSINYATGPSQGNGYVDELVSSGLFTIQGTNQAGQLFNPTTTITASSASIWIKKTGAPGNLTVSLQTAAGTVLDTGTISAASIGTAYAYVNYSFPTPKTLIAGTSYRLILSSSADVANNYQIFPMQKGSVCCGFNVTSTFTLGNYQTNTGSGWTNYLSSTSYDAPAFLNLGTTPPWAPIINSPRAIDWSLAGVIGGIPTTRTQCNPGAGLAPYSGSGSTISTAVNACAANTFYLLQPGTFALTSAIKITTSNVTLRGSGSNSTFLTFGNSGCGLGGQSGSLCAVDTLAIYNGNPQVLPPNGIRQMTGTAGFTQGSTNITANACGTGCVPPVVGGMIIIDQEDDTTDNGGIFVCSSTGCNAEGAVNAVGRTVGGLRYSQQQIVTVTAISGSGTGPYSITFTPGLYAPNWAKAGGKGLWWSTTVQGIGFENFSADFSANTGTGFGISLYDCKNCWVKGVRGMQPNGQAHVLCYQSDHDSVVDSYFYGSPGAEQSYGVEHFECTDLLVQNDIFQQVASPTSPGNYQGSAVGYNFSIWNKFINNNWMQVSYSAHNTAGMFNLFEGNIFNGLDNDNDWGTAPDNTYFRNRLNGAEKVAGLQRTQNTMGTRLDFGARGFNLVGNVIGTSPFITTYETSSAVAGGSTTNCWASVYVLGYRNVGNCSGMGTGPNDPLVRSTLIRWGNWDNVTNAVKFDATESSPADAGSGATLLAGNTTPTSQTLPASFYLSAKPSWFGSVPWPPIGPDVTGGNITGTGGHANKTPAELCYENIMLGSSDGTGPALSFDSNACYNAVSNPVATLSTASIAFGSVSVNSTTAPTVVTLTNTGNQTLNISFIGLGSAPLLNGSSLNWQPVCLEPSCHPGGSGIATGASQSFGKNAVFSLTGPPDTNALYIYKQTIPSTALYFTSDFKYTPDANSARVQQYEFDHAKFVNGTRNFMMGSQCNKTAGVWDIFNQGSNAWVHTSVPCVANALTQYHVIRTSHISGLNMIYDDLTIDGVVNHLGITEPSSTTTFGDAVVFQNQMNIQPTGAASTVTESLTDINFLFLDTAVNPLSETTTCGATLAPAASCTINVVYSPTVAGGVSQYLNVGTDDPSKPTQAIPVTGTAVAASPRCGFFQPATGKLLFQGNLTFSCQ